MRMLYLPVLISLSLTVASSATLNPEFPLWPFGRLLQLGDTGRDVLVLNRLLLFRAFEYCPDLPTSSSTFDNLTFTCLSLFQAARVPLAEQPGTLDAITAVTILNELGPDHYVDNGLSPFELGYQYKVLIRLPSTNRSVEATAFLIASNGTELFNFTVRVHGAESYPAPNWPSWNSTDSGLSEFASDGATPTGLCEFDLNSPETNASEFGPYPINRAVRGLQGNWQILMTNDITTLRDGILLHTGEWPGWSPPQTMPNSLGCIHAYPDSIKRVWETLVSLGVNVRNNTNGNLPYPYQSQGLLSIECPLCTG
jgi:hypothetical protein